MLKSRRNGTQAATRNYGFIVPPPGRIIRLRLNLVADDERRWASCPQCKQSCTGKYNKKYACTRCGWIEGKLNSSFSTGGV